MENFKMRRYENDIITDFFKQQNWRCRAAIATLRNRRGDDWVDLFLTMAVVREKEDILPFLCSSVKAGDRSGDRVFSPTKLKIVLEDFKKIHSEEKYGWIDTMLMSLVLQVVLKYFVKWLIDNFTIENKDT
jgi:hypothetical protein